MKITKKNYLFCLLIIVASFVVILAKSPNMITSDTCWHLKVGEWIANNKAIPTVDRFSYHNATLNFMAHEWLFDTVAYKLYSTFGLSSLYVVIGAISLMGYIFVAKKSKSPIMASVILFLFTLLGIYKPFALIPDTISAVIMIIMLNNLLSECKLNKKLLINSLLTILLVNINGGMMMAALVQNGVYLIIVLISTRLSVQKNTQLFKKSLILLLDTIICSMINPYGIKIFTYAFRMLGTEASKYNTDFVPYSFVSVFAVVIFVIVIILGLKNWKVNQLDLPIIGLYAFYLVMFFTYSRCVNLFILATMLILSQRVENVAESIVQKPKIISIFNKLCVICAILIVLYFPFADTLLKGTDYIQKDQIGCYVEENYFSNEMSEKIGEKKIFSPFDLGGYLIFKNVPVFIDGRIDPYVPEYDNPNIFMEHQKALYDVSYMNNLSIKYDFDYLLFHKNTLYTQIFIASDDWEVVLETKNTLLLERKFFEDEKEN